MVMTRRQRQTAYISVSTKEEAEEKPVVVEAGR
jgi:hypothetical protein